MPHLIGDDLAVRILQYIADGGGIAVGHLLLQNALIANISALLAKRCQFALEQAKQRGFTASGRSAQHHKLTGFHTERQITQCLIGGVWIAKTHIFDL